MNLPSALFSLMLLFVSAVLMLAHWRGWNAVRQQALPQEEYDYRRRQCRRRMQASGMIGIVGIALFLGETFIRWFNDPVVTAVFWAAVVLVTVWMALLALVDIWATKRYVNRAFQDDLLDQTKLQAELYRVSEEERRKRREDQGAKE
jgi:hypothetical protein